MEKKEKTYVASTKFVKVAEDLGVPIQHQTGYMKIEINGRRLYVSKTKNVGRCDIAAFVPPEIPGVVPLDKDLVFGRVTHEIDFDRDEATILAAFESLLKFMKETPAEEKEPVKKKAKAPRPAKKKVAPAAVEQSVDQPAAAGPPAEEKAAGA